MNLSTIFQSPAIRPPPPAIPTRAPVARQPSSNPAGSRAVDSFTPARSATGTRELAQRLNPAGNPKYLPHGGNTYCNVYSQDFMRARGVTLPQKTANDTSAWLHSKAGAAAGWRQVSGAEAQRVVNSGGNGLVTNTHNPHGHIAPIVEGTLTNGAPTISNAGSANFNIGPSTRSPAFQRPNTEYWVHN